MLEELLFDEDGVARYPDHQRVRLSIQSADLAHDIWIHFVRPSELTTERIMIAVGKVLQSKREWAFASQMKVLFVHADLPYGGRGIPLSRATTRLMQFLSNKRSVITIKPDRHNLCFARALVVAAGEVDRVSYRIRLRRGVKMQSILARSLHADAKVPVGSPVGHTQWEQFQQAIGPQYSIVIVSRDHFNTVIFWGKPSEGAKVLSLYLVDKHFHVITKLSSFMGEGYVCPYCSGKSRSRALHVCNRSCYSCKGRGECVEGDGDDGVRCGDCGMYYVTAACYDRHRASGLCERRRRCDKCGVVVMADVSVEHKCFHRKCKRCMKIMPAQHECYMQVLSKPKQRKKSTRYYFYDFESVADAADRGRHTPNLCVVHRTCALCMDRSMERACDEDCGRERRVFKGEKTLTEFCEYLFDGKNAGAVCIAHNAGSYDMQFVMGYVHGVGIKPEVVVRGTKMMCMKAQGLRFVDSINFIPMALAKIPKAFDLKQLRKGWFPHRCNRPENVGYVGPMPKAELYEPSDMKDAQREEFLGWYEEHKDDTFDMDRELLTYCISDVDILQRGCGAFRRIFVEHTGVELFERSITLSAACMRVFRTRFLRPDTIALIPVHGYFYGQQSAIAVCWLTQLSEETGVFIRHYGNYGEVRVEGRYVDGVSGEDGKTLYSFLGCVYHSCALCYPDGEVLNPFSGRPMREKRDTDRRRTEWLRERGYVVVEMWECSFRKDLKKCPKLRALYEQCKRFDHINPRDSLYGGRTSSIKLYKKAGNGARMDYVDFNSLYPFVNFRCTYPVGHPTVYVGEDIPASVNGLLKCKVLPPRALYLPVLPFRCRNKLLFPLCRTCAENCQQAQCPHEEEEDRAIVGTWVTDEIDKAVQMGYVVLERYEAWHFREFTTYDVASGKGGLLSGYVQMFIKLKQEASGFPAGVESDGEKAAYMAEYERMEGIALDKDRIVLNNALRTICKRWVPPLHLCFFL